MASTTKKKRIRKLMKQAKKGASRKNRNQIHGTTARNLPLDKPNANELAQKSGK